MNTAVRPEFNTSSIRAAFASWLGMFLGPNSMVAASMSLFMAPIAAEFHLKRSAISLILMVSPWTTAFFSPFAGRALDRFGLRNTLVFAIGMFGLMGISRGFVHGPVQLAFTFFLVSIASALNSSVGYSKLVSLWFSKHRGLVLGLVTALGAGAGSALAPQVVRLIIGGYGWRVAYIAIGGFIALMGLPLMWMLMKEPPRPAVAATTSAPLVEAPGLTRAEAIRTRTFWFLFLAIFLASMALIGTNGHAVPMLTERGFTSLIGVTAISCFFAGGVLGQLTAGAIADRIDSSRVVVPFFVFALVGVLIVHTTKIVPVLLGGAFVMGLGQGAEIAFAAYLASRFFGLKAYGAIYGLLFAASNVGIGVGLGLMGLVHDWAGSYKPMALVFGGALAVSVVLVTFMGPYRFASRRAAAAAAPAEGTAPA
jgi:MFS family permease